MITREEMIKRLRKDPMYLAALKMAKTDEERRKIISTTESFLGNIIDSFVPAFKQISTDKTLVAKLQEAINAREPVITENNKNNIVSGSNV